MKQWVLIGGYGELGDSNWGFDNSKIKTEKWLKECRKHIGKTVLLTGGGSFGKAWLAKLTEVDIAKLGDASVPQVRLENIKPKWNKWGAGENVFTPYLGSWQISIKQEVKSGKIQTIRNRRKAKTN